MSRKRKIAMTIAAVTLSASMLAFVACNADGGGEITPEQGGNSNTTQTDKSPEQLSPYEVAYAYLDKQSKLSSYELHSTGQTVASLLGYTQYVNDLGYKFEDEYYKQNVSTSTFANVNHESFAKNINGVNKVAFRNDGGDISVADRDGKGGYKSVYGVSPDDVALGGYIINSNTLLKAERLTGENRYQLKDEYSNDLQYHFEIATTDEATVYNKLQMVEYGQLSAAPDFTSIHLYLTIAADWTPRELISHVEYNARKSMVFNMSFSCTQDITATYTNVNSFTQNPIPDTAQFNAALGSNPSQQVVGGEVALHPTSEVTGALLDLAEDVTPFGDRIKNTGMHFGIDFALPIFAQPISVSVPVIGSLDYYLIKEPATAEIYVKYNEDEVTAKNYLNAVNLYAEVDLSGFMEGETILGSILMPLLPTIVGDAAPDLDPSVMGMVVELSQVNSLKVYYLGTGSLYVTLLNKSDMIYSVKTVTVNDLLPLVSSIGGSAQEEGGSADLNTTLSDLLKFFEDNFTVEVVERATGTDTVLSLVPETVEKISRAYTDLVTELDQSLSGYISRQLGVLAGVVDFDLQSAIGADICSGKLHIIREITDDKTELKEIYFEFRGYTPKDKENVDENGVPLTDTGIVRIGVTNDGDLTNELQGKDLEVQVFLEDEKVASLLRSQIDWYENNLWIDSSDTFLTAVNALTLQYNRFTPAQKALVSNSSKIGISGSGYKYTSMIATYNSLKQACDTFLTYFDESGSFVPPADTTAWLTLNKLYDEPGFTAAQKEYVTQQKVDLYLAARAEWTNGLLDQIKTKLAALKTEFMTDDEINPGLTADDIIKLVKSLVNGTAQFNGEYSLEYLVYQVQDIMPEDLDAEFSLFEEKALTFALNYVYDYISPVNKTIADAIAADAANVDLSEASALDNAMISKLKSNFADISSVFSGEEGKALAWYELAEGWQDKGAEMVTMLNYTAEQVAQGLKNTDFQNALKDAFNTQFGAVKEELLKGLKSEKKGFFSTTYSVDEEYMATLDDAQQQKLLEDVNYWYDIWQKVNNSMPALSKIINTELDKFHSLLNEWMAAKA